VVISGLARHLHFVYLLKPNKTINITICNVITYFTGQNHFYRCWLQKIGFLKLFLLRTSNFNKIKIKLAIVLKVFIKSFI